MLQISLDVHYSDFHLSVSDLAIQTHGVTALFGRSGSGKSTLLKAIAGLEPMAAGRIEFNGETWLAQSKSTPTQQRNIGYVFQQGALFPTMTVRENLAFARDRAPKDLGLETIAKACQIEHRLDANVASLSGGEKQRAVIARTLLSAPDLLLLDEPMSALDSQTKLEILPFLEHLKIELNLPIILVSHSPDEVLRLADQVVFMADGRVSSVESVEHAVSRSDSPLFVESGPVSLLSAVKAQEDADDHIVEWTIAGSKQSLLLPIHEDHDMNEARLSIRAADVSIALEQPTRTSLLNHLHGTVSAIEIQGHSALVSVDVDGHCVYAQITQRSVRALGLQVGQSVVASVKGVSVV